MQSPNTTPGPGGPGQDECCDCGTDLREAPVVYGAGTGSGTGRDGYFRCETCHTDRKGEPRGKA